MKVRSLIAGMCALIATPLAAAEFHFAALGAPPTIFPPIIGATRR